jgi:hypothetical protein
MNRRWSAALLGSIAVLLAGTAAAQTPTKVDVPEPLAPWVQWALHDDVTAGCPQVRPGSRACVWPGRLQLTVSDDGGTFVMAVWVDAPSTVVLPGSAAHWPQDVEVDGKPAVVAQRGGLPAVELTSGPHELRGRFFWKEAPGVLAVPPSVAQVDLRLGGKKVPEASVDDRGRLLVQPGMDAGADGPEKGDSLKVTTYRHIYDGVPLRVTNRFEVQAGGRSRRVTLDGALLEGARPLLVRSDLPVQVGKDGNLTVYLRPGGHTFELDTVIPRPIAALQRPDGGAFSEPQEIWLWDGDAGVRSVKLTGLSVVDPARTSLPPTWQGAELTMLAEKGDKLSLEEVRRGEQAPPPNDVSLTRALWLDLDGRGWTVRDRLGGSVRRDWRLDYGKQGTLGRVTDLDVRQDLLVTTNPGNTLEGVEIRRSALNLQAEVRLEDAVGGIDIVGWDHDVNLLNATVHVPPGWELIGASGVRNVPNTWWSSWTLFDVFFLLIISLVIGRLCGWQYGLVAAVALTLSQGHPDAPRWVWVHLVVSLALLRQLKHGWARRAVYGYRLIALLALVLILAPHANDLVLTGVHPQVSRTTTPTNVGFLAMNDEAGDIAQETTSLDVRSPVPAPFSTYGLEINDREQGRTAEFASSISGKEAQWLRKIDKNAIVQTGRGLPDWSWKQWTLHFDGPVMSDRTVTLWLLPPLWHRLLSVLRVLLLLLLGLALVSWRDMTWGDDEGGGGTPQQGGPHSGAPTAETPDGPVPAVSAAAPASRTDERSQASGGLAPAAPAGGPREPAQSHTGAASAASAALLTGVVCVVLGAFGAVLLAPASASAQVPPESVLAQLRARVLAEDDCAGPCVNVSRAEVVLGQDGALSFEAEVHAVRDAGWFLPTPSRGFRWGAVEVDGSASFALRREAGGLVAVRLPAGRHQVVVRGDLGARSSLAFDLDPAAAPRLLTATLPRGWSLDGVGEHGVPEASIQVRRATADTDHKAQASTSADLPPWFAVRRELLLGLPWKVRTIVTRENVQGPALVRVPLLEGESILTEGFSPAEDGRVLPLEFGRGAGRVEWTSQLPVGESVTLSAPKDRPWTETWSVDCAQVWRCQFSGIPAARSLEGEAYRPIFFPWPGESASIAVSRPEGVAGPSATIDRVEYDVTPGDRVLRGRLWLAIRASQAGWHALQLPAQADLKVARVNGVERNLVLKAGKVEVPLTAGRQELELVWVQPWERALVESVPPVHVGSASANTQQRFFLAGDRWVLWTQGPAWGPSILVWTRFAVLIALGLLLAFFFRRLPLRPWDWPLLLIGFTQLSYIAVVPIVLWFVLLAWRGRRSGGHWLAHNAIQAGLALVSLVAAVVLYLALTSGLVAVPDFGIGGGGSGAHVLGWYVDRTDGALPVPTVVSLPLFAWRLVWLAWSLWLAWRMISWGRWFWQNFSAGGVVRMWEKITPDPVADGVGAAGPAVRAPAEGK